VSAVQAAARQGDRHTHWPSVGDHDGSLLSVAAGALLSVPGTGGVTVVMVGAGVASGGGSVSIRDVTPRGTSGAVSKGSPRTFLGKDSLPAALANDEPVDCHRHRDGPIRTGSATVFVDGLRLARQGDETKCGAMICDGELTVLIGGPPVDGAPPDPMAAAAGGPALGTIAVGGALAVGTSIVKAAQQWGEALLGSATAAVDDAAAAVQEAAGALGAEVGALLGGGAADRGPAP
jgi:uncharacterized Zn-binding protein involved in type VI secretion